MKRLISVKFVSLEAFKMYYVMRASAPSLHRESTDSLIYIVCVCVCVCSVLEVSVHVTYNYRLYQSRYNSR